MSSPQAVSSLGADAAAGGGDGGGGGGAVGGGGDGRGERSDRAGGSPPSSAVVSPGDEKSPRSGGGGRGVGGGREKRRGGKLGRGGERRGRVRSNDRRGRIRAMFRDAKDLERRGCWREAVDLLRKILDLDPRDSHSHLALARLQARRERGSSTAQEERVGGAGGRGAGGEGSATEAFRRGTVLCPRSVHLWQAWALHESGRGDCDEARRLFGMALDLDPVSPYVCHAYGLMERKAGNAARARELWETALGSGGGAVVHRRPRLLPGGAARLGRPAGRR